MRKKEHSVEVEKGLWCEKHARTHSHKQHKILTGAALAHTQRFSHAIAGGRIRSCSWKKDYSRARGVCPFFSSTPTLCVAGNIGNCGFTTVCVCSCSRLNVYDCVNPPHDTGEGAARITQRLLRVVWICARLLRFCNSVGKRKQKKKRQKDLNFTHATTFTGGSSSISLEEQR